jgi:hypothetical protein
MHDLLTEKLGEEEKDSYFLFVDLIRIRITGVWSTASLIQGNTVKIVKRFFSCFKCLSLKILEKHEFIILI